MLDQVLGTQVRVEEHERANPTIRLSRDQVDAVKRVLEEAGVRHWVRHGFSSHNGGPYIGEIVLWRANEGPKAQAALDEAN